MLKCKLVVSQTHWLGCTSFLFCPQRPLSCRASRAMARVLDEQDVLGIARSIIPSLQDDLYKGDLGRVGVVGGCREYTGAPYFGAFTALRLGADLSHVFCSQSAALAIKCHSPELIVHPYMFETGDLKDSSDIDEYAQKALKDVANWFSRLDSLVVGPGIGRDPLNLECSRLVIESARHHELPLILDADGLYIVTQNLQLIQGCSLVVLTPNINELRRLARKLDIPHDDLEPAATEARMRIAVAVAGKLNGPTIVSKGSVDIIAGGNTVLTCSGSSSNRRCGGLGDVLAGCISVFYHWSKRGEGAFKSKDLSVAVLAAYGACYTVRKASVIAFTRMGRSMLCGDVIADIGQALSGLENGEKE